jgi:hypothetical protein
MAASKSAARKSAAKKAAKTRKSRATAKKAANTRKRRSAGKKAAATRKRRAAAKKAVVSRTTNPAIQDIDARIAIIRNNLRELVEQAAGFSGASNEELMSNRIAQQEAKLDLLKKQRERLS